MSTNDATSIDVTSIDAEIIAAWAAMAGLVVPDACMPGVVANLDILRAHAARIDAAESDVA